MILGADLVIVWVITKQSAVYNFLTTVKILHIYAYKICTFHGT